MKIIFEGGGFPAFWYGLGYGIELLKDNTPTFCAGYSAGALVAVILTCSNVEIERVIELYGNMPLGTRFGGMAEFIASMMNNVLPLDAHVYANGYIGIILCDPNNNSKCKMVTKWESRDDLIQCLVASCYIPCFMGCARFSDELYQCRDAVFSSDLSTFLRDNFDLVVGRPVQTRTFSIEGLCENLSVVTNDGMFSLLRAGSKAFEEEIEAKKHE